jgi:hypothetical protein
MEVLFQNVASSVEGSFFNMKCYMAGSNLVKVVTRGSDGSDVTDIPRDHVGRGGNIEA